MRDIQKVLEHWGHGRPAMVLILSTLAPLQGYHGYCPPAEQAGHRAAIMTECMIRLSEHDEYLCSLLEWHYIDSMTLRAMATKLGISHNHVSLRLQVAESFIQDSLCTLNITLEMDRECQKEYILPPKLKGVV